MQRFRPHLSLGTRLVARLGGLLLSLVAVPGCLEVERAQYCNRVATQIRATFPTEKVISTSAERRHLASDIDKLLDQLSQDKAPPAPLRNELNALSQELKTLTSDLKRSSQTDSSLTAGLKKKMSDSLQHATVTAERLRTACH